MKKITTRPTVTSGYNTNHLGILTTAPHRTSQCIHTSGSDTFLEVAIPMIQSDHNLHVCNPFMLRECLLMALEVSEAALTKSDGKELRSLLITLHHGTESDIMELSLQPTTEMALVHCLAIFKQTHTWQWLRGDFRDAILKLEHYIDGIRGVAAGCP